MKFTQYDKYDMMTWGGGVTIYPLFTGLQQLCCKTNFPVICLYKWAGEAAGKMTL